MRIATLAMAVAVLAIIGGAAKADKISAVMAVRQMPRVIDAVPDNGGNLWVSVAPDTTTPWNQFAAAACLVVRPHNARIFQVKVVDATSIHGKDPRAWRQLGVMPCSQVNLPQ